MTHAHQFQPRKLDFSTWSELFSGKLFMHTILYADESGSGDDTGATRGSEWLFIGGYIAWVDDWKKFCIEWQRVLDTYSAFSFHFSEWADAAAVANGKKPALQILKNQYQGWDKLRLDGFLYDLAKLAGNADLLSIGTHFETKAYHKHKQENPSEERHSPYGVCAGNFYENLLKRLKIKWPYLEQPISFFYDTPRDRKWKDAVSAIHDHYRDKDSRIREIKFARQCDNHLPLQAADMLVFRMRQIKSNIHRRKIPSEFQQLDRLLFRKDIPPWIT
jgi:hypothetical protein